MWKHHTKDWLSRTTTYSLGFVAVVSAWQLTVLVAGLPSYIFPGPSVVARALAQDWATLLPSLGVTARTAFASLILAFCTSTGIAVVLVQSPTAEKLLFPAAVALQVTPLVAIAPLVLLWVPDPTLAQLICAWLVAFFPLVSNAVQGLKSANQDFDDLLDTYGASRWQRLCCLQMPSALPYLAAGLRTGGGLSLVAAVVAEFATGTAGRQAGIAFRLLEGQYRLNTPRVFAALSLLIVLGLGIFALTSAISWALLRYWRQGVTRK